MNSNKNVIPHCRATNYIPYKSSMSQLSGDMFHVNLGLGDSIWAKMIAIVQLSVKGV